RFNVELKTKSKFSIAELVKADPFIAITKKFDSNIVFELGRRYGFNGRIFSHAIVLSENLLVEENSVKGWAFIPQEGNTILSTIHAFLLQTKNKREQEIMEMLIREHCREEW